MFVFFTNLNIKHEKSKTLCLFINKKAMANIFELTRSTIASFQGATISSNGINYTIYEYLGMALGSDTKIIGVSDIVGCSQDFAKKPVSKFTVAAQYWGELAYWALTNYKSNDAAKRLLVFVFPVSMLKTSAISGVFGTAKAAMSLPVSNIIAPNFATVFGDNIQLLQTTSGVAKSFSTIWGVWANSASITVRLYDDTNSQDSTATGSVSNGRLDLSLTSSKAYTDGSIFISGVVFARNSYSSVLTRDVTISELYGNYLGASFVSVAE